MDHANDFEAQRTWLTSLARLQLDPTLRGLFDPEDFVQETMFEAHQKQADFRNEYDGSMRAWLRTIMLRKMMNAVERERAQKRDGARTRSIEGALEKSSARLKDLLEAENTPPSERARRNETAQRLEEAMARLPEDERQAIGLTFFHDWTQADIARHLNLSQGTVTRLLRRALKKVEKELED